MVAGIGGYFYEANFDTGASLRSGEALGAFQVNGWHNLLHLVTGGLLLVAGGGASRSAALSGGGAYLVIALLGFVATGSQGLGFVAEGDALFEAVPVNDPDNVFHLVLGLAGVAAASSTAKRG